MRREFLILMEIDDSFWSRIQNLHIVHSKLYILFTCMIFFGSFSKSIIKSMLLVSLDGRDGQVAHSPAKTAV